MTAKHLMALLMVSLSASFTLSAQQEQSDAKACVNMVREGFRPIDDDRTTRFLGKVAEDTATCRGGQKALKYRYTPWADWGNYWADRGRLLKERGG